jgi:hypothetical protein
VTTTLDILKQMRQAREASGLDLPALERRTRVRIHLLDAVENGRFDELPRGVYARAVVRAYASGVGIDPNRAVTAIGPLLPEAEDPLDGIARVRGFGRAASPPGAPPAASVSVEPPTDELPSPPLPRAMPEAAARSAAAAIDGGILAGIELLLLTLTAETAGVAVGTLIEFATPALLMLFMLIATLYFGVLGGIAGSTAGSRLMRLDRLSRSSRPLSVALMTRRAGDVALRELSILVDVLLPLLEARVPGGRFGRPRSETPWAGRAPAR